MKKFFIGILCIAGVAYMLGLGVLAMEKRGMDIQAPQPLGDVYTRGADYYIGTVGAGNSGKTGSLSATTTTTTLVTTATASTTIVGNFRRGDSITMKVQTLASSSAASFNFVAEYADAGPSNTDCASSPTTCAWFPADKATSTTGNVLNLHEPFETTQKWPIATTSLTGNTTTRVFTIKDDITADFFRIRIGTSGANQEVWVKANTKESF